MFYLRFNFDFYVSEIMHFVGWESSTRTERLAVWGGQGRDGGEGLSAAGWLRPPGNFIAGHPKAAL